MGQIKNYGDSDNRLQRQRGHGDEEGGPEERRCDRSVPKEGHVWPPKNPPRDVDPQGHRKKQLHHERPPRHRHDCMSPAAHILDFFFFRVFAWCYRLLFIYASYYIILVHSMSVLVHSRITVILPSQKIMKSKSTRKIATHVKIRILKKFQVVIQT